jgi:hypothetical protein
MSLSNLLPRETRVSPAYDCNGSRRTFGVPFWFLSALDLVIVVTLPAGGKIMYLDGAGYSVSGAGLAAGGDVTLDVAPPSGASAQIFGKRLASRLTSVYQGGQVNGAALDIELDAVTATAQELRRDVDTLQTSATALKPDASGPLAARDAYDDAAPPFTYLQTDDAEQRIVYYVKLSAADGDWSPPLLGSFAPPPAAVNGVTPEDYGASGSLATTTASTTAGAPNVALASATGFAVGQGVRINRAGATFALNLPTGLSVAVVGATGATTRKYAIRAIDDHGGLGPAVRATVANAHATLDFSNYCRPEWSAPAGTAPNGYAVYGRTDVADGSLTLIGVTSNLFFNDYGAFRAAECDWLVANDAGGPFNGYHVGAITALAGSLATVNPAPAQTVAAQLAAHDDTAAIVAMLAAAGARQTFHWAGTYPVTSKIQFSKLGVHRGGGAPDGDAATRGAGLVWRGAPGGSVAQWGHTTETTVLQGGVLSDMEFDGAGVTDRALIVKDASTPKFAGVKLRKATRSGLLLTSTGGATIPTSVAARFTDLFIPMLDGRMDDAHCVEIDGLDNNLTLPDFYSLRGSHVQGHGVYWPPGVGHGACDGVSFYKPFLFRTNTSFGYSIYVGTDDPEMVTGDIDAMGVILLRGGIYFASPGRIEYSSFNNFDTRNVGSARFASMPFEGPGVGDLSGNSLNGTLYGWRRHPGGFSSAFQNDDFEFIDYVSGVVRTANCNWKVAESSAGGSIVASGVVEGINLTTSATLNQRLTLFGAAKYKPERYPAALWSVYLPSGADIKARVGFLQDANADPASRVCWRYNAATGFWECECFSGGVGTTVATTVASTSTFLRLRVEYKAGEALFYYYLGNSGAGQFNTADLWYHAATITTNVPTGALRLAAQVEALAAEIKTLALRHVSASQYMGGW